MRSGPIFAAEKAAGRQAQKKHSQTVNLDLSSSDRGHFQDSSSLYKVRPLYQAILHGYKALIAHLTQPGKDLKPHLVDRGEVDRDVWSVVTALSGARAWPTRYP